MAAQADTRVTTFSVLPNIVVASALCSASIIEFTIPQVGNLSQNSADALPPAPLLPTRAAIFARAIGPQWALTVVQFLLVKVLRAQRKSLCLLTIQ